MKRINKKGFTLVELLAVIVVLAILILLAIPAVTSMMDKARKNAFEVEVENVIKVAKSWKSAELLDNEDFSGNCISVKDLISQGYLEKKKTGEGEGLDGAVCVEDDGKVYYEISNKYYSFSDYASNATVDALKKGKTYSSGAEYASYTDLTQCGQSGSVITLNSSKNDIECKTQSNG